VRGGVIPPARLDIHGRDRDQTSFIAAAPPSPARGKRWYQVLDRSQPVGEIYAYASRARARGFTTRPNSLTFGGGNGDYW
jgi:hypothetical protein